MKLVFTLPASTQQLQNVMKRVRVLKLQHIYFIPFFLKKLLSFIPHENIKSIKKKELKIHFFLKKVMYAVDN